MMTHPRLQEELIGHEKVEQCFLKGFNNNRLHHSLLIHGDYGIGKATFVYRVAKFLLSYPDVQQNSLKAAQDSSSVILVNSLTHPDLMVIEDEKISVDSIREIGKFLSLKSARGKYRVVVIDSLDNMNINASNALLKLLEEPPADTVLLLVCHDKRSVLPTILSRCSILRLARLSFENFKILIEKQADIEDSELMRLYEFSNHSIGRALCMHENDFFSIYEDVKLLLKDRSYERTKKMIDFARNDQKWDMLSYAIMTVFKEKLNQQALAGSANDNHLDFVEKVKSYIDDVNSFHTSRAHAITAVFG